MIVTVAIGDVHGHLDKLTALVSHCRDRFEQVGLKFVFIGDYVDRGPDSKGVIDFVRTLPNTVTLKGNHEDMMFGAATSTYGMSDWMATYGHITMPSFGVQHIYDTPQHYLTWMNALPFYHTDGLRTYVHAGIQRRVSLINQNRSFMIWARDEFMSDTSDNGGFVVHGHTPLSSGRPDLRKNRINLDTGACFGGPLTGAVFTAKQVPPSHYIQNDGTFKAF